MSAAVTPLHPECGHANVDIDALLADDSLAAAVTAPVVPGTTEKDIQRWMVCVYRHAAYHEATPEAVCALLQKRNPEMGHTCVLAKVIWKNTEEYAPLLSKIEDWLAEPHAKLPQESGSDIGNARRLAVIAGTDIAHDAAAGWRVWADSSWISDPAGAVVQRAAKGVSRMIQAEADALTRALYATDNEAHQERIKAQIAATAGAARRAESAKLIGAMTTLVRDEPGVLTRADQWNANSRLLACPGTTIELGLDGHAAREPRRADRLTRVTRGRPSTGTEAPLWTRFLETSLPNRRLRRYVQRLLGYGLLGSNPERKLVIFIGDTSTGKTTIGAIVGHALGEYAGPFSLSLFRGKRDDGPRADLVRSLPRRMIFASEASERWVLHGDEIKRLTGGGDKVEARDLYAKAAATAEREPAFLPILSTNSYPTVLGADAATWGRMIAVPWNQQIDPAKQDPHLAHKICTQETDAVLDWLLYGYDMYCSVGLADPPTEVDNATMALRASLTPLDQWLAEDIEHDAKYTATNGELWPAYREWCKANGIPDEQRGTSGAFYKALGARGYKPWHTRYERGWSGLRPLGSFAPIKAE